MKFRAILLLFVYFLQIISLSFDVDLFNGYPVFLALCQSWPTRSCHYWFTIISSAFPIYWVLLDTTVVTSASAKVGTFELFTILSCFDGDASATHADMNILVGF